MEPLILAEYLPQAIAAHRNISFDPEKRGEQLIKEYSEQLSNDLKKVTIIDEYSARYKQKFAAWLSAKSRTFSVMITGPGNFPVRRHKKANEAERNRYEEFRGWRERTLKAIEKQAKRAEEYSKTDEQKSDEKFEINRKNILSSADTVLRIDLRLDRGYNRALFVKSIVLNVETAAKNGDTRRVQKCLDLIKELNEKALSQGAKVIVTDKHSVWKLAEQAEATNETKQDRIREGNKEIACNGYTIIENREIDRLQIKHDQKPSAEVISQLKKNAFKWSPSQGVWQRQLTGNAVFALEQMRKNW